MGTNVSYNKYVTCPACKENMREIDWQTHKCYLTVKTTLINTVEEKMDNTQPYIISLDIQSENIAKSFRQGDILKVISVDASEDEEEGVFNVQLRYMPELMGTAFINEYKTKGSSSQFEPLVSWRDAQPQLDARMKEHIDETCEKLAEVQADSDEDGEDMYKSYLSALKWCRNMILNTKIASS